MVTYINHCDWTKEIEKSRWIKLTFDWLNEKLKMLLVTDGCQSTTDWETIILSFDPGFRFVHKKIALTVETDPRPCVRWTNGNVPFKQKLMHAKRELLCSTECPKSHQGVWKFHKFFFIIFFSVFFQVFYYEGYGNLML